MKTCIVIIGLLVVNGAAIAHAQFPDQIYTNGKEIEGWSHENGQRTTMWFHREPGDRIVYVQSQLFIDDDKPQLVYYFDLGTMKYVGRYSFPEDKYSILPEEARREHKGEIPEKAFRKLGEMPTVNQLLSKSQSSSRVADPPPTGEYPRLTTSSWDTAYFTKERQRIRAKVTFDGNRGTFRAPAHDLMFQGTFEDVRHERAAQGLHVIRGTWRLGAKQGYFRFNISLENLNVFQGEWGYNDRIEGTWNGARLRQD